MLIAQTLGADDEVAIEATGNALAIARILSRMAARGARQPKAVQGDRRGARRRTGSTRRSLARLLAAGSSTEVWTPDDEDADASAADLAARRAGARAHAREEPGARGAAAQPDRAAADERHVRRKGRVWLAEQGCFRWTSSSPSTACLRQVDFLDGEIGHVDQSLGADAISDPDALRLLTLPGVNIGHRDRAARRDRRHRRFPTARQLVGYLGLDPRVRQSGNEPARHGGSASRAPARSAACSSKPPGTPPAPRARCAHSTSASPPPRQQHRDRRRRAQDGRDRLAYAQPRRGLRVHAARALPARRSASSSCCRRPAPPEARTRPAVNTSRRPAPSRKQIAAQPRSAYRRMVNDWQADRPAEGGRGCDTGARIS